MCVYIVYKVLYTCACMCVHVCTMHMCMGICICICICMYVCECIRAFRCQCTYFVRVHASMFTYILKARVYTENTSDARHMHIPRYPTRKHCKTALSHAYIIGKFTETFGSASEPFSVEFIRFGKYF